MRNRKGGPVIPGRAGELYENYDLTKYLTLTEREEWGIHMAVYASTQGVWLGHQMQKCPLDLMSQHDIIWQNRPDCLVETGTWKGASALFYATLMEGMNHGFVITVDHSDWVGKPNHPRINYITGKSTNPEVMELIHRVTDHCMKVMVVLDSDHTKAHVLQEMDLYAPLVTMGQYMIVEDTNIHGHPIRADCPEGPYEAVQEWLTRHDDFVIDSEIEPIVSHCPKGYLQRIKEAS
jgi:cephalosporin hydroxylase